MTYVYRCKDCNKDTTLVRLAAEMNLPAFCESCGGETDKLFLAGKDTEVRVANNALTTDFGDGCGEQTYTRRQYIDKCKHLGREPVGLCFR